MQLANQAAQKLNHEYIGTEHILLGIVREGNGVAANLLTKQFSVNLAEIDKQLCTTYIVPGPDPNLVVMGKLPQTPGSKVVIERSILEARELYNNYVGTEHILLGLLFNNLTGATKVLNTFGVTLEKARELIKKDQDSRQSPTPAPITKPIPGTSTVSTGKGWEHWVWNGILTGNISEEEIKLLEEKWRGEWAKNSIGHPIITQRSCTISADGKELKMKVVCEKPKQPTSEEVFGKSVVDSHEVFHNIVAADHEVQWLDKKVQVMKDRILSILKEEMEACKQAGKMAEACVLLKVIKKIEVPPTLSWLNETLGS